MSASITSLFLGRTIANREADELKIGVFEGVPAMGLDGLGSAAYGPEAALTILAGAGAAGLGVVNPITWIIVVLLAALYFFYRQTTARLPRQRRLLHGRQGELGCRRGAPGRRRPDGGLFACDAGEQVVEVVGEAAGELADVLHLLDLPERFLCSGKLSRLFLLRSNMAAACID